MINLLSEADNREKFCILPFNALQISQFHVTPCCKMQFLEPVGDSWKETFDRYFSSQKLKLMQDDFLANQTPMVCQRCFLGNGQSLYPGQKLKDYRHSVVNGMVNPVIQDNTEMQMLNILLTNTCNLRCRHCSPGCSSSLNKIWDDNLTQLTNCPKTPPIKSDELIDELISNPNFAGVRNVLLSGGEPLMLNRLREVTEKFAENGANKIGIVTNLSDDPFDFLDYFNQLGEKIYATVTVSVDGDKDMHAYHRNGLDIEAFVRNAKKLSSLKNIHVCIMIAVDAINIFKFPAIIDFLFELFDCPLFIQLSLVENDYLRIRNYPIELRQLALDRVKTYIENFPHHDKVSGPNALTVTDQIRQTLEKSLTVPFNQESFDKFLRYLEILDSKYETSFREEIPELAPFLQQAKPLS